MIRLHAFISAVLCMVAATHFVAAASAADIRISDHPAHDVVLEGAIERGDYERFLRLVKETCSAKGLTSGCPTKIFLASPGGNVAEALRIGRLIRELRWETQIPVRGPEHLRTAMIKALKIKNESANFVCASACFFLFVAGVERDSVPSLSVLGMHRPYLSDSDLRKMSGDRVIDSSLQVRVVVAEYLKEMGVPARYAEVMFSIPKDQVRWVSEAELQGDFSSFIPELKDWIDAQCVRRPEAENKFRELDEKIKRGEAGEYDDAVRHILREQGLDPSMNPLERQVRCERSAMVRLRSDAWKRWNER